MIYIPPQYKAKKLLFIILGLFAAAGIIYGINWWRTSPNSPSAPNTPVVVPPPVPTPY